MAQNAKFTWTKRTYVVVVASAEDIDEFELAPESAKHLTSMAGRGASSEMDSNSRSTDTLNCDALQEKRRLGLAIRIAIWSLAATAVGTLAAIIALFK